MGEGRDEDLRKELSPSFRAARVSLARNLGFALLLASSVVAYGVWNQEVESFLRGEIDWTGETVYRPRHAVDQAALESVDFSELHRERIPRWTIELAYALDPVGHWRADRAFARVREVVAADENLVDILSEIHILTRDDPIHSHRRLDYLLWAYNEYLDRHGIPWRLEAALVVGHDRVFLSARSYEVVADATNDHGNRVRLLRRADRMNSLEGWLGRTPNPNRDGAFVLMRRVLHFTVRHVWPSMHPALDARRPDSERPWLTHVRRELQAQLSAETYQLLSETAVDQQALIEVSESIEARHECGNTFRIVQLPYNGLSDRSTEILRAALAASDSRPDCPLVTLDEAARIVGASERLSAAPALVPAVEELATVVARAVAYHELQHVIDGEETACVNCPVELEGVGRDEVSAYLSAFRSDEYGYLSLLMACARPPSRRTRHGQALDELLELILPFGCDGPTRHNLYEYAGTLEDHLFGTRPSPRIPDGLPDSVPLLSRARRAALPMPPADGWGMSVSPGSAQPILTAQTRSPTRD